MRFRVSSSEFGLWKVVQNVQVVQAVQTPTSFLPRDAGEDDRRGLKPLKHLEQLEPNLSS